MIWENLGKVLITLDLIEISGLEQERSLVQQYTRLIHIYIYKHYEFCFA